LVFQNDSELFLLFDIQSDNFEDSFIGDNGNEIAKKIAPFDALDGGGV
jgi:hypothetical protein